MINGYSSDTCPGGGGLKSIHVWPLPHKATGPNTKERAAGWPCDMHMVKAIIY